ncbi:MAG: hypothetical protein R2828_05290 [Saprospiraceae bacterium]
MKYLLIIFFSTAGLMNSEANGQVFISGHSLPELNRVEIHPMPIPLLRSGFQQRYFLPTLPAKEPMPAFLQLTQPKIPQTWSYQDLAFFCRLEVKMGKAANIPIKVRLGEVQYVENMEGKYGDLQQQLGNH